VIKQRTATLNLGLRGVAAHCLLTAITFIRSTSPLAYGLPLVAQTAPQEFKAADAQLWEQREKLAQQADKQGFSSVPRKPLRLDLSPTTDVENDKPSFAGSDSMAPYTIALETTASRPTQIGGVQIKHAFKKLVTTNIRSSSAFNLPEQQGENHNLQRPTEGRGPITGVPPAVISQMPVHSPTNSETDDSPTDYVSPRVLARQSQHDTFVLLLLQEGAYRQALPYLEARAAYRGGDWLYRYADAAKQSGETKQLAQFFANELARNDLPRKDVEERIWAFIDALPTRAVRILRDKTHQSLIPWVEYYCQALKETAGDKSDLRRLINAKLSDASISDTAKGTLLAVLSTIADEQAVISSLHKLSLSGNEKWFYKYTYQLQRAGLNKELIHAFREHGLAPNVPTTYRRNAAYALLELGEKAAAVQVFRALGKEKGTPKSRDVQELLFLWGPRPNKDAIEWLAERALAATVPQDCATWLRLMIEKGGAPTALRMIDKTSWQNHPSTLNIRVKGYYELKQDTLLRASLRKAIKLTLDKKLLTEYAELARGKNFPEISRRAWETILRRHPGTARPLKELGLLAYERDSLSEAQMFLMQYAEKVSNDFEASYYYAECLRAAGNMRAARKQYRLALSQVQANKHRSGDSDALELVILCHLGKLDLAREKYRALSRNVPAYRAKSMLNTYAEALISAGWNKEALSVLSSQNH
jgi:hypothetical protein